ncbi:MAG: hypothetical protein OXU77_14365 [Gammaproteobacteria bacterium]|nr:hypothetical protein [Gammaproteobacteria bacterium]
MVIIPISKASRQYRDNEALGKLVEIKGAEVNQAMRVVLAALKNQETKKVAEQLFEAQRNAFKASWVALEWIRLSEPSPNATRAAQALLVAVEAEVAALNALVELACEQ